MGVSTFVQPDYTSQTATVYKTSIDDTISVLSRISAQFAPHEQSTPDMTIALDAGSTFNGVTLNEVAAQNTGTITAPSGNPRIDRVTIQRVTGSVLVVTGTEAASPVAPAIPDGRAPVARISLAVGQTEIKNVDITDERDLRLLGLESRHERKTDDYTAIAWDNQHLIEMDKATAVTLTLTAAATLREGWYIYVHNSGAGVLTIDPNGGELIDDVTTITLSQNESTMVFCTGGEFWTVGLAGAGAASQAEQEAGSSTNVFASPGTQQFHVSAAKLWCRWDNTGTIQGSSNVDSVTDVGVGEWTINITTDFADTDYVPIGNARAGSASPFDFGYVLAGIAVGSFAMNGRISGTLNDGPDSYSVVVFGDQ